MNATLWEVLEKTCVGPVLITERFAMEQTMLITLLHHHVGTEVGQYPLPPPPPSNCCYASAGAYIIQKIVSKLDGYLWSSDRVGAGKEADCLVLLLAQLYNYQVCQPSMQETLGGSVGGLGIGSLDVLISGSLL